MSKSKKRRETRGPMSAAGLISFYEELEEGLKISPTAVLVAAVLFTIAVAILSRAIPP